MTLIKCGQNTTISSTCTHSGILHLLTYSHAVEQPPQNQSYCSFNLPMSLNKIMGPTFQKESIDTYKITILNFECYKPRSSNLSPPTWRQQCVLLYSYLGQCFDLVEKHRLVSKLNKRLWSTQCQWSQTCAKTSNQYEGLHPGNLIWKNITYLC